MAKRGTYRFEYTGTNLESWLDNTFSTGCSAGLDGVLLGNEGNGMIVVEGKEGDVDNFASTVRNDSDVSEFETLMEEWGITSTYTKFREFIGPECRDEC